MKVLRAKRFNICVSLSEYVIGAPTWIQVVVARPVRWIRSAIKFSAFVSLPMMQDVTFGENKIKDIYISLLHGKTWIFRISKKM